MKSVISYPPPFRLSPSSPFRRIATTAESRVRVGGNERPLTSPTALTRHRRFRVRRRKLSANAAPVADADADAAVPRSGHPSALLRFGGGAEVAQDGASGGRSTHGAPLANPHPNSPGPLCRRLPWPRPRPPVASVLREGIRGRCRHAVTSARLLRSHGGADPTASGSGLRIACAAAWQCNHTGNGVQLRPNGQGSNRQLCRRRIMRARREFSAMPAKPPINNDVSPRLSEVSIVPMKNAGKCPRNPPRRGRPTKSEVTQRALRLLADINPRVILAEIAADKTAAPTARVAAARALIVTELKPTPTARDDSELRERVSARAIELLAIPRRLN